MISSTGLWFDWKILHQLKTRGKLDRALNSVLPCRLAGELPLFLFLSLFLDYFNTLVSKTTERTKTHTTQLTPSSHPCLALQIFTVPSILTTVWAQPSNDIFLLCLGWGVSDREQRRVGGGWLRCFLCILSMWLSCTPHGMGFGTHGEALKTSDTASLVAFRLGDDGARSQLPGKRR